MCNTRIKKSLNKKMKLWYLGPLIVVSRNKGGAYILCKLDGSVLQNSIAQFRIDDHQVRLIVKIHRTNETIM